MKNKFVGLIILMLLTITIILPVTEALNENIITSTEDNKSMPIQGLNVPILNITGIISSDTKIGGIIITLYNSGEIDTSEINWYLFVRGGIFYPRYRKGKIGEIGSKQSDEIEIGPMFRFGKQGNVTIYIYIKHSMQLKGIKGSLDLNGKQEWVETGNLFTREFDPNVQPEKNWVGVDEFKYYNNGLEIYVELKYRGIEKCHNVRVISSAKDSKSQQEILFLDACCFQQGVAIIKEAGITRSLVEGDAEWQVELTWDCK